MDETTRTLHRTSITINLSLAGTASAVASTRELLEFLPEDQHGPVLERVRALETELGWWIGARFAIVGAFGWEEAALEAERKGYPENARASRDQVALSLKEALACVKKANEASDREHARRSA